MSIGSVVRTEGGILPSDLIARVVARDKELPGLDPQSYGLAQSETISEATGRSWARLRSLWTSFREVRAKAKPEDALTKETRERWLLPLFQELDYGKLERWEATSVGTRSYAISHRHRMLPIHLIGANLRLDRRTPGVAHAAAANPHGLLQDFLNRKDEFLWGIVSNGLRLRLLRDNVALTRQAYVEFDLEGIFEAEDYPGFVLLWLLAHQSRFDGDKPHEWIVEQWSRKAVESGSRALEQLRHGVEQALAHLGTGFLRHPANLALQERLRKEKRTPADLKNQLMRLVYRLLFLFVAEDRDLLLDPKASAVAHERYRRYYSTARLRSLALGHGGSPHGDAWEQLRFLFRRLRTEQGCPELGLNYLGSRLFSAESCPELEGASLSNQYLYAALRALCLTRDRNLRRKTDFLRLGAEELGSVYESLLELVPQIHGGERFELVQAQGNDRKLSGSYYTPTSLIQELLRTALDPVLDATEKSANPEEAVLSIKVCDPACGSGHFLVAAAHRIARRVASIRTGDAEPAPEEVRHALRQVVARCLYGVDLNPLSVELCKVSLWLESLDPGKPLAFLDHRIKVGNSLIGATPTLISQGIPDDAYTPISGDDKTIAAGRKKVNRKERDGAAAVTGDLFAQPLKLIASPLPTSLLRQGDDGTLAGVKRLEEAAKLVAEDPFLARLRLEADYWTSAFLVHKVDQSPFFSTGELKRLAGATPAHLDRTKEVAITDLRAQYAPFHWHVEFPDVFDVKGAGGFEVLLGNPPWEHTELKELEWFAFRSPDIANSETGAKRKHKIAALEVSDPSLWKGYQDSLRQHTAVGHFISASGRFPLTGRGRINTFAVFAELMTSLMSPRGRAGFIVPTSVATDDTTKEFFQHLVSKRALVSLLDFQSGPGLWSEIGHARFKFCLLTLSAYPIAESPQFAFFLRDVALLRDPERVFNLSPAEIELINPNTRTCPIFRTRRDAEITKKIYERHPILLREARDGHPEENPWGVRIRQGLFNMTSDSHLFKTRVQLERDGWRLAGNRFRKGNEQMLPLYEAKLFHHFDHRWATFVNEGDTRDVTPEEKTDPSFSVHPRYWVPQREVQEVVHRLYEGLAIPPAFFLVFRDICRSTDERTAIFSIIPSCGIGNNAAVVGMNSGQPESPLLLATITSSLAFDFQARLKVGGTHLNFFIANQLPVLDPETLSHETPWHQGKTTKDWILPYALELLHTTNDLDFGSLGVTGSAGPFKYFPERRQLLRAELDAGIFLLFGYAREEVEYAMSTFPILKEKDEQAHGTYRTRELILAAFDQMAEAQRTGKAFKTALSPSPAHSSLRWEKR